MKTRDEFLAEWSKVRANAKTVEIARLSALQDATVAAISTALDAEATSGKNTSLEIQKVSEVDYEPIFVSIKEAGYELQVFPDRFVVRWSPEEIIKHDGVELAEAELKDAALASRVV